MGSIVDVVGGQRRPTPHFTGLPTASLPKPLDTSVAGVSLTGTGNLLPNLY